MKARRLPYHSVPVVFASAMILAWACTEAFAQVAKAGAVFDRRLEAAENQSVVEHWSGKQRLSRRSALSAEISYRLVRIDDRRVVLRGDVSSGHFELGLRGFLELEDVYGLFFDSLTFELTITPRGTRLTVDPRRWKAIVTRFEKDQRRRGLTDALRDEVKDAFLKQLERAQLVSFWPLLPGEDDRGGLRSRLSLALWRAHGKVSGHIRLEPLPDLARFFDGTAGAEIPLRRWHRAMDSKRAESAGMGTLAWRRGKDGLPSGSRLEAFGDYVDRRELDELVERPDEFRQYHEIDIWLGPPSRGKDGVAMPSIAKFTGLPPFFGVPDLFPILEVGKEREVLTGLMERAAAGGGALERALDEYAAIERARELPARVRAAMHFALAEELAIRAFGAKDRQLELLVGLLIRETQELPLFVLSLRAVSHLFAKISDVDRMRLYSAALSRHDPALARWGSRMVARGRAKGSASLLVDALRKEIGLGANGSDLLRRELRFDLVRLLGPRARALGVEELEKLAKVDVEIERPRPFTLLDRLADPKGPTYFEEAVSGPTVFVLDASADVTRSARSRRGKGIPVLAPRMAWARIYLDRTLRTLGPADLFGIVKFHGAVTEIADKLIPARDPQKRVALAFLRQFELVAPKDRAVVRRARYEIAFPRALSYEGVETIVLLSDSARGDFWRVEADLLVANYLRGVRVVTYGHAAAIPQLAEEPPRFLERLAYVHDGWCRFVD